VTFFGAVERDPSTNRLHFGGDPDQDPGILNPDILHTRNDYRVCQKSDTLLVSEFSTLVRCIICNFCLLTHRFH